MAKLTREEQQALAAELAASFTDAFLEAASKAPDYWDGRHFRLLLKDIVQERFGVALPAVEAKEYANDRLTIPGL